MTASVSSGLMLLAGNAVADSSPQVNNSSSDSTSQIVTISSHEVLTSNESSNVAVSGNSIVDNSQSNTSSTSGNYSSQNTSSGSQSSVVVDDQNVSAGATLSSNAESNRAGESYSHNVATGNNATSPAGDSTSDIGSAQQDGNTYASDTSRSIATHANVVAALDRAFANQRLSADLSSLSATSYSMPDSDQSPISQPTQPKAPGQSGVLGNLNQILSLTLVPQFRGWLQLAQSLATALPLAMILLIALVVCVSATKNSYIGLVRQMGFAHSPRSDLAPTSLSFVTPQSVSLPVAASPPIGSLFGGVENNQNKLTYRLN